MKGLPCISSSDSMYGRAAAYWDPESSFFSTTVYTFLKSPRVKISVGMHLNQVESWILQWHLALITLPTNRFLFKQLRDTPKIFPYGSCLFRSTLIIVFSQEQLQMPLLAFTIRQRILLSRVTNFSRLQFPELLTQKG